MSGRLVVAFGMVGSAHGADIRWRWVDGWNTFCGFESGDSTHATDIGFYGQKI